METKAKKATKPKVPNQRAKGSSGPGTPHPADGPSKSPTQHSEASIFKQAWNLLNNVRDELVEVHIYVYSVYSDPDLELLGRS
jgi:hypothetical protein